MKQITLAKLIKKHPQYISDAKRGKISINKKDAKILEQVTGIHRDKWLYPEEKGDPFVELKKVPEPIRISEPEEV